MNIEANIFPAILLTLFAGLSTGIGSLISYFIRKPKLGYLSFALACSTGVMIYISFMELMPVAMEKIDERMAVLFFFIGIVFTSLIDHFVPESKNPHAFKSQCNEEEKRIDEKIMKIGIFSALAIGIHNFPEGIATFMSAVANLEIGVVVAIAVAIHNIPEGISVSIPIFFATSDRKKALLYSFLSGISEPLGAIAAYFLFLPFLTQSILAGTLAFISGVMVYISLDELLPLAHSYGNSHIVLAGLVLGMAIMAVSLLIL